MKQDLGVPVITIDGGAGTGKGTVSAFVADRLGFNYLDSGVLYRVAGVAAQMERIIDEVEIANLVRTLQIETRGEQVWVNGYDWTAKARSPEGSKQSSIVSAMPEVRKALLDLQLSKRCNPGLVADGRDMGFVFETPHRFFLTASVKVQAHRRYLQSKQRGEEVNFDDVLQAIVERDERDKARAVAPLRPHPNAVTIHTDPLNAAEVAREILSHYHNGK